jgi:hypothetical protein
LRVGQRRRRQSQGQRGGKSRPSISLSELSDKKPLLLMRDPDPLAVLCQAHLLA